MRIVAFKKNSDAAIGVRDNNQVVDLSIAAPELPQTLRGLLVTDALGAARVAAAAARRRPVVGRSRSLDRSHSRFPGHGLTGRSSAERPPPPSS